MLGRIFSIGAPCLLLGSYLWVRKYPIALTNPYFAHLMNEVNQHNPSYSIMLFKALLKLQLIAPDPSLGKYILKSEFDIDGKFIQQIRWLGFGGIEIGPISFNPTQQDQNQSHLGIVSALARICSYRSSTANASQFEIHLHVVPNLQVLKFVPYLVKENIIQSVSSIVQIQKQMKGHLVDRINIDFDHKQAKLDGVESGQVQTLMSQTRQQATKLIRQVSEEAKVNVRLEFGPTRQQYLDWNQLLAFINQQL